MSDAREVAYDITRRVNAEGGYLSLILRYGMSGEKLDARDRSLVTELSYGVQRHRGRLDFAIATFSTRPVEKIDPELLDILRLAMYQLLEMRTPRHAAVNESVKLARKRLGRGAASFVNAVMRKACDGLEDIPWPPREQLTSYLEIAYSHPRWMAEYLLQILGPEEAEALCAFNNTVPGLTLRVNTARLERASLLAEIESHGGRATPSNCTSEALRDVSIPYDLLLGLLESGYCVVQDESSILVGLAVDPGPGDLVIDACAAPGGKASHLAVLGGDTCRVIAVDRNARRLDALRRTVDRLGLKNMEIIRGDSTRLGEYVEEEADAVLVDAPCSGLGTLRRNPELKWRRQPGDLEEMSRLQYDLLEGCASRVRPGGLMLYSVCTYSSEETTAVVDRFLSTRRDFNLEGQLQIWPHIHHLEGMFISRLTRS